MSADNSIFAIPLSRLNDYERRRLEQAGSSKGDPYQILRRKTIAVAQLLGCDEATAEAIVLGRIDAALRSDSDTAPGELTPA